MTAKFSTQLRSAGPAIEIARGGAGTVTLRVEASDVWATARVIATPETPVSEVKQRALEHFFPNGPYAEEFVLKFRGWEILDEGMTLKDVGIADGSILLLAIRRRRPVR